MALKLQNLEAILAIDNTNGLAKNDLIPWKCKTDMIFFKNETINNIIIMGSKTLKSLPYSQPLKNRTNIVLTNEKEKYLKIYGKNNTLLFLNFDETIKYINQNNNNKFYIIGGNEIYNLFLQYCSSIWITRIKKNYDCDLQFNYDLSSYIKKIVYDDSELEIIHLI